MIKDKDKSTADAPKGSGDGTVEKPQAGEGRPPESPRTADAPEVEPAKGNGSGNAPPGSDGSEVADAAPEASEAPAAAEDGQPAEPVAEGGPAQDDEAEDPIWQARREAEVNFDKFLRLQAEFENYKKRIRKEHQESLKYALTPLVREVAGILDNLGRAADHARKEAADAQEALLTGIEMVLKQMNEALARFGVSRIEAAGKPFDPNLHEAMLVVETDDVPENQVMEEFLVGYLLHDRVIRPAQVSVSKRTSANGESEEKTES